MGAEREGQFDYEEWEEHEDYKEEIDDDCEGIPLELYPTFIKDPSPRVKLLLATVDGLPEQIASMLLKDQRLEVMLRLAMNESLPPTFLEKIENRLEQMEKSESENVFFKRCGRKYDKTYVDVSEGYEDITYSEVREIIVSRNDTPAHLLTRYLKSENQDVRERAVMHKNLNKEVAKEYFLKLSEELNEKAKNLKEEDDCPDKMIYERHIIDTLLNFGMAPREEMLKNLDYVFEKVEEEMGIDPHAAIVWGWGRQTYGIGATFLLCDFRPEEMEAYYEKCKQLPCKVEDKGYIWAGIMANPATPQHVKEDFYINNSHALNAPKKSVPSYEQPKSVLKSQEDMYEETIRRVKTHIKLK